nr:S1/P1 nuclease [uncultured Rhodoferax sp.]
MVNFDQFAYACRRLRTAVLWISLVCISHAACAWGNQGHQVIALLAEAQLSPVARKEVNRLLALEPGETLASISTWADEHRSPATAAWHYVNFPRGACSYEFKRDCPDGKCIVAAIEKQLEILATEISDEKKLAALKYVVHLIGDIHQPLHAGHGDDRGGNTYQLQAFMRGSNLHAFWDTGMLKSLDQDNESVVRGLLIRPLPQSARTLFNPATTAEESCMIVGKPDFYPERIVTPAYMEAYTPVMLYQLALAGSRLAQSLNGIFR